jgi:hypothetical protein
MYDIGHYVIVTATELLKHLNGSNWGATDCPEAMGVNVTATMKNCGVELEWPLKT